MKVVQGDNGVNYPFIIPNEIDLTGATVKVILKRNGELIEKTATVANEDKGECFFTLLDTDTTTAGDYQYQWLIEREGGFKKYGWTTQFYVAAKAVAGGVVDPGDGSITVRVDGGTF